MEYDLTGFTLIDDGEAPSGDSPDLAGFTRIDDGEDKAEHDFDLTGFTPVGDSTQRRRTFGESIGATVDETQAALFGTVEAAGEFLDSDTLKQFGGEGRRRNQEEAAQYPEGQQFLEIQGLSDAGQFAKETLAEMGVDIGPGMAGAAGGALAGSRFHPVYGTAIGGVLGAFVPSWFINTGEVQKSVKERGEDFEAPSAAFIGGTAVAALDTVLPGKLGTKLAAAIGLDMAETVAKKLLAKDAAESWVKRGAKNTAKGFAVEGLTEAGQEAIEEVAAAIGTDTDIDPNLWKNMVEAAAKGGLMGGMAGGASTALDRPAAPEIDPETNLPEGALPAEQIIGSEQTADSFDPDPDRINSPRLTDSDRASPIPNDLIDDGKVIIEQATEPKSRAVDVSDPETVQSTPEGEIVSGPPQIERDALSVDQRIGPVATGIGSEVIPNTGASAAVDAGDVARTQNIGDGTKQNPIEITGPEDVHRGSEITADPTPAQAEAGNYRKRRVKWNGLNITVETEQGAERTGKDSDGNEWSVTMPAPYGEIARSEGADGDPVDVYIGPSDTSKIFVVDQVDPKTSQFDEHKVMLGFATIEDATATYDLVFSDGSGPGRRQAVTEITLDQFKDWLKNGNANEPFGQTGSQQTRNASSADQASVSADVGANTDPQQLNPKSFGSVRKAASNPVGVRGISAGQRSEQPDVGSSTKDTDHPISVGKQSSTPDGEGKSSRTTEPGLESPPVEPEQHNIPDSPNYTDLGEWPHADKTPVGRFARDYVVEQGRKDGVEFMLAFDADGSVLAHGRGERSHTGMSGDLWAAAYNPARNIVVHHNHPRSLSFSVADIAMVTRAGMEAVWAHGHDGSSSYARLTQESAARMVELGFPQFEQTVAFLKELRSGSPIHRILQDEVNTRGISVKEAELIDSVANNEALQIAGVIDYLTTIERHHILDREDLREAVSDHAEATAKAFFGTDGTTDRSVRRAVTFRHVGDLGVLAEGTGRDSFRRQPNKATPDQGGGRGNRGEARTSGPGTRQQQKNGLSLTEVENYKIGDDSLRVEIVQKFSKSAKKIEGELRATLNDIGLPEVGLRIVDTIRLIHDGEATTAQGRFFNGLIDVALDAGDPNSVLQHEAVHALRQAGVFTDKEWASLTRRSVRVWMPRYNIREVYAGYPESTLVEEGIAHAFADWATGKKNEGGVFKRVFEKIKAVLVALRKALHDNGYRTVNDIFGDMRSGEIGRRPRPVKGQSTALAVRSLDKDLFATEVVETASGPVDRFGSDGKPIEQDQLFALRQEPETSMDRQRVQQGWLARGQLIDRAVRMPFDIIGGIDDQGRWNPGVKLTDKSAKIITEAKFPEEGVLASMNPVLEAARAGLIDRYGLSKDYIRTERQRGMDARRIMVKGADFLKDIKSESMTLEEARVLQAVMTGKSVDNADIEKMAAPIIEAIDQLGQEAVTLGLLSNESYERNRGSYLHRVYLKHETGRNSLTRFAEKFMSERRRRIIGSTFKGRGIFLEVELPRLTKKNPQWPSLGKDLPENGDRFRVLDRIAKQDETDTEKTPRVLERVYLSGEGPIPEKYSGWKDGGVWEVRGRKKGKFVLWRDYTDTERGKMGEIFDARYTIGKTFTLMANDLANGRFFKALSENEEWTRDSEPETAWRNASDVKAGDHFSGSQRFDWVKVPDTDIPGTGGKKRWGALSGKYVRSEIWRDLTELDKMQNPGWWRTLYSQWKLNKTARNPVVHMNNIMSNIMLMDMVDVRAQDLYRGIRSYHSKDQNYQDALEHGAYGSDQMSQEIRDNVLKPLLDEIEKDMQGGAGTFEGGMGGSWMARAKLMGKFLDRLWAFARTADRKMIDFYRAEDEVFRMAYFIRRREMGDDAFTAADLAREQFLDYDVRAPIINLARNTALPFIAYTYRAVPLISQAMAHRPWKLVKYFTIAHMANMLAYGFDDEADEEKERYSLRDEEQGYTWIRSPRMVRMPFRDKHGLPVFLDIRRWIPAGDVFDLGQGAVEWDVIPAPLLFGGPIMLGAEFFLNKKAFDGEEIRDETDTFTERAFKTGDWALKSWLPSAPWIPGSWYWNKIGNAWRGATDGKDRPYSLPLAALSSVGVKIKPQDVENGLHWKGYALKKENQQLRNEARKLGRQLHRKLISQETYDSELKSIVIKLERLQDRADELSRISSIPNR